jgi:hypothetical protein
LWLLLEGRVRVSGVLGRRHEFKRTRRRIPTVHRSIVLLALRNSKIKTEIKRLLGVVFTAREKYGIVDESTTMRDDPCPNSPHRPTTPIGP